MATTTGYQSVHVDTISPDRPLFGEGENRPRDRIINLIVGFVTALVVLETFISAFIGAGAISVGLNIFFAICIAFLCLSHLLMIYWYRQGDVDPKFKNLIYYNAGCLVLLCICANIFFHHN